MAKFGKSNVQLITRFGILTDIQYADTDNRPARYDPSKTRYYRASLDQVKAAFNHWNQLSCKPSFVLQLGDIIDGLNFHQNLNRFEAISSALKIFKDNSSIPTFHTLGNHELYNFKRSEIFDLMKESLMVKNCEELESKYPLSLSFVCDSQSKDHPLYYEFHPVPGLKLISLDCYDISVLGYEPHHSKYQQASDLLYKYHGHRDWEGWDLEKNLPNNLDVRFTSQNGALSEKQLMWLDKELEESDDKNEKVIVFGHVGIHPNSCEWSCLLWNYDKVLEIFHKHTSVISYLSGHAHAPGYCVDNRGIHYIVFNGIIETTPDTIAFATISVYENRIEIDGQGSEQSYHLELASNDPSLTQFNSICHSVNEDQTESYAAEEKLYA